MEHSDEPFSVFLSVCCVCSTAYRENTEKEYWACPGVCAHTERIQRKVHHCAPLSVRVFAIDGVPLMECHSVRVSPNGILGLSACEKGPVPSIVMPMLCGHDEGMKIGERFYGTCISALVWRRHTPFDSQTALATVIGPRFNGILGEGGSLSSLPVNRGPTVCGRHTEFDLCFEERKPSFQKVPPNNRTFRTSYRLMP
eukprot:sb/3470745/